MTAFPGCLSGYSEPLLRSKIQHPFPGRVFKPWRQPAHGSAQPCCWKPSCVAKCLQRMQPATHQSHGQPPELFMMPPSPAASSATCHHHACHACATAPFHHSMVSAGTPTAKTGQIAMGTSWCMMHLRMAPWHSISRITKHPSAGSTHGPLPSDSPRSWQHCCSCTCSMGAPGSWAGVTLIRTCFWPSQVITLTAKLGRPSSMAFSQLGSAVLDASRYLQAHAGTSLLSIAEAMR